VLVVKFVRYLYVPLFSCAMAEVYMRAVARNLTLEQKPRNKATLPNVFAAICEERDVRLLGREGDKQVCSRSLCLHSLLSFQEVRVQAVA
jgi:hypothetical protein